MNTATATKDDNHAIENGKRWYATIEELIDRLQKAEEYGAYQQVDAYEDADAIRNEIHEGPLSVMVRDGWHSPGLPCEDGAEEYEILLSTGGPALRIYGHLGNHFEPASAELQWQDWFKPWTRCTFGDEAVLLAYARQFYFGD